MLTINDNLDQGRYRIVGQLGLNGSGPVYEAYDNILQTNVVLREIPFKLNKVTTPTQLENLKAAFSNEAKVLTSINHGSFIHVQGHFSEIDRHYLVMEQIEGSYLNELLEKNGGAFSLTDMIDWADQLLDALNYLHTQSPPVIHRDIKPQNIQLTPDGKIKLLALAPVRNSEAVSTGNQTFEATSLNYLPLEQIWGKLDLASQKVISNSYDEASEELLMQPPDARSDIYALGATLYHLITARHPVDALERSIDMLEGKPDPLPTPSRLDPNVPPEISYVLMKAMELKREKRFDSALIMRQVLKTAALRAKEREAQEAKKPQEISAPEIRLPEPKQFGHRPPVEAKTPEIKAERQQPEPVGVPLPEAESRSPAEQRIFAEPEVKAPAADEILAQAAEPAEDHAQVLDLPVIAPEIRAESAAAEDHNQLLDLSDSPPDPALDLSDTPPAAVLPFAAPKHAPREPEFSLAEEPKDKKTLWRALAAAAVLLVVCGAGFGVWSFLSSNNAGSNGQISSPAMSLTDSAKPETQAETAPAPNIQTTTENDPAPVNSAAPELSEAPAGPAAIKVKDAAPTPAKKPDAATAKSTPKPKKSLTVDDLINDN